MIMKVFALKALGFSVTVILYSALMVSLYLKWGAPKEGALTFVEGIVLLSILFHLGGIVLVSGRFLLTKMTSVLSKAD